MAVAAAIMPVTPAVSAYASPAGTSRRHLVTSGSKKSPRGMSSLLSPQVVNDDQAEKSERQMSKVLEMQQRHLVSPGNSRSDRRQSLPLGGLSNAQLTDHYADCIKLSAENKISAKNAFGLHLIDYMMDLFRKKDVTDFQMASSTLDASAKIYAGRVDAIHSEMYKVLSGLGRGAANDQKQDNEDGGVEVEGSEEGGVEGAVDGQGDDAAKKRKRGKKSKTIETNLKNITVNKFDMEFEVDAAFQTNLAAFDDGGTNGLLLNNLHCFDDSCQLQLDFSIVVNGEGKEASPDTVISSADVQSLKECFGGCSSLEKLQICPAFESFEFNNWNAEEQESMRSAMQKLSGANEHAFDINAEPESVGCNNGGGFNDDINDDDDDLGIVDDADDGHYGANDSGDSGRGSGAELMGRSHHARDAAIIENTIMSVKNGELGSLIKVLASEPSDYSYFKSDLLKTWVGPEHWKLRSRGKGEGLTTIGDKTGGKSKSNRTKQSFVINFCDDIDIEASLRCTRAATTVAKAKLEKNSKIDTKLPDDLHYDGKQLLQLFEMPAVLVKWQNNDDAPRIEVESYNYDNDNDHCNFCPEMQTNKNDDDNDDCGFDNFGTIGGSVGGADDDDDDDIGCDFNLTSGDNTAHSNTMFSDGTLLAGDNLIAPPRKIARIEIDYARVAKRVDVKRLKGSMWEILTLHNDDKSTLNKSQIDAVNNANQAQSCHETEFHSLVGELSQHVPGSVLKNLSVPIIFVCLLHLANEKTLDIKSSEDLCNMIINQG